MVAPLNALVWFDSRDPPRVPVTVVWELFWWLRGGTPTKETTSEQTATEEAASEMDHGDPSRSTDVRLPWLSKVAVIRGLLPSML